MPEHRGIKSNTSLWGKIKLCIPWKTQRVGWTMWVLSLYPKWKVVPCFLVGKWHTKVHVHLYKFVSVSKALQTWTSKQRHKFKPTCLQPMEYTQRICQTIGDNGFQRY